MIDLNTDGAGINAASFSGILAIALEFERRTRAQKAERVEIAFKVSPLSIGSEYALPLGVCSVSRSTVDYRAGSFGCQGHRNAGSRIKDEAGNLKASGSRSDRNAQTELRLRRIEPLLPHSSSN